MRAISTIPAALAALAFTASLAGADIRMQLQISTAQGEMREVAGSRLGYGVGIHTVYALVNGDSLRPRADLNFFPMFKLSGVQNTASSLGAGCDYIHFLGGALRSVYLVGGMSLVRWSAETVGAGSGDTTKLGLSLGAGYRVTETFGWEARYSYSPLTQDIKARTLGAGLTFRF